jgi:hypothetical protein
MSRDDDRQRPTATRGRRARRDRTGSEQYKPSSAARATSSTPASVSRSAASEHYHREKARRANRNRPDDHPMEQARRAYQELLASDAAKMRGGRPKKMVTRKPTSARIGDEADDR